MSYTVIKLRQKLKSMLFKSTILPYSSKSCTFIVCIFTGPKYSRGVVITLKLFCSNILNVFACNDIRANIFLFKIDELNAL